MNQENSMTFERNIPSNMEGNQFVNNFLNNEVRTRKRSLSTTSQQQSVGTPFIKTLGTVKTRRRSKSLPIKRKKRSCNRWTEEENERLRKAFEKYGGKNWTAIAKEVGNKTGDQCNQHWHRVINPAIKKEKWSNNEDDLLLSRIQEFGESAWKSIAKGIDGRTDLQCRHRWTQLKRMKQKEQKQIQYSNSTSKTDPNSFGQLKNQSSYTSSPLTMNTDVNLFSQHDKKGQYQTSLHIPQQNQPNSFSNDFQFYQSNQYSHFQQPNQIQSLKLAPQSNMQHVVYQPPNLYFIHNQPHNYIIMERNSPNNGQTYIQPNVVYNQNIYQQPQQQNWNKPSSDSQFQDNRQIDPQFQKMGISSNTDSNFKWVQSSYQEKANLLDDQEKFDFHSELNTEDNYLPDFTKNHHLDNSIHDFDNLDDNNDMNLDSLGVNSDFLNEFHPF